MHVYRAAVGCNQRTFRNISLLTSSRLSRNALLRDTSPVELSLFRKFPAPHQNHLASRLSKWAHLKKKKKTSSQCCWTSVRTSLVVVFFLACAQAGCNQSSQRHALWPLTGSSKKHVHCVTARTKHNRRSGLVRTGRNTAAVELKCTTRDAMASGVKYRTAQRCRLSNAHPACSCVVPFMFIKVTVYSTSYFVPFCFIYIYSP